MLSLSRRIKKYIFVFILTLSTLLHATIFLNVLNRILVASHP